MGFLCCCFFVVFFNLYAFLCGGDPLEIGDVSYLCTNQDEANYVSEFKDSYGLFGHCQSILRKPYPHSPDGDWLKI